MSGLRLVADDLTGALDAAAAFARPEAPIAVVRTRPGPDDVDWAWDAATRDNGIDAAAAAARHAGPLLRTARIAFRKLDSMLRGHVAAEIVATARAGSFASVIVAPAFPAQGRITRGGRQWARMADDRWAEIEVDLAPQLASLAPCLVSRATDIARPGNFLCDAETDEDLRAIVAAGSRLASPVLWCGSAGLARALAGGAVGRAPLPAGPVLGVIGSRNRQTAAELDRLFRRRPETILWVSAPAMIDDAIASAARRLAGGASVMLALRLPELSADAAASILGRLALGCARLRPSALFASGGATLAALTEATDAARLDCLGEIMPGVPISRVAGGRWDGIVVVSKSGGFAAGDLLATLFCDETENHRAQA